MAQTRRKRRTKHRGNAAGMIEVRGRTGRAPTPQEKGQAPNKKDARVARADQPPTWKAAFRRAMIAAVLLLLLSIFVLKGNKNFILVFFPVILAAYTAMTYYMDRYLYRRRLAKKQGA